MPKPNTSYQEGEKYIMEDVTSYDVAWIKKKKIGASLVVQ